MGFSDRSQSDKIRLLEMRETKFGAFDGMYVSIRMLVSLFVCFYI